MGFMASVTSPSWDDVQKTLLAGMGHGIVFFKGLTLGFLPRVGVQSLVL